MNITLKEALKALDAALDKSTDLKLKMNVAVVDAGANLVAFGRQDGAWLGSKDIAIRKAQTAVYFQMPSADIGKLSQPGGPLYMIEVSNGGLVSFGGGLVIYDGKEIIGGIGVSGDSVPNDVIVATAGRDAVQKK